MPISATGKATVKQPAPVNLPSLPAPLNVLSQRGFTLLEIMLVMAVMAMVAGLVLPNLFRPATDPLDNASRHMVRLLHLASEEAQLRGVPLRWNAYADHYTFELAGEGGEWQALTGQPFAIRSLPAGVSISDIRLANGAQFFMPSVSPPMSEGDQQSAGDLTTGTTRPPAGEKPPLGSVVFMSDGMLTLADVHLHSLAGDARLELRPGPAGIRILGAQP